MKFQDFITRWNGKYIDFDGVYGAQCMDLMHQYIVEVLDFTDGRILAAPAAKDVFLNFQNVYGNQIFEKIDNTPTGVPKEGDIMFWGTGIGQYGHVAIFVEGDANNFRSFDENFPIGSPCHIQSHSYSGVLGWLRTKQSNDFVSVPKAQLEEFERVKAGWNQIREKLNVEDNVTVVVGEIDKLIGYQDAVLDKDKQLVDANAKLTELDKSLAQLNEVSTKVIEDNKNLDSEVKEQSKIIQGQDDHIAILGEEIKQLKENVAQPQATGWRKFLINLLLKL